MVLKPELPDFYPTNCNMVVLGELLPGQHNCLGGVRQVVNGLKKGYGNLAEKQLVGDGVPRAWGFICDLDVQCVLLKERFEVGQQFRGRALRSAATCKQNYTDAEANQRAQQVKVKHLFLVKVALRRFNSSQ